MRGVVSRFDEESLTGEIGGGGRVYSFRAADWRADGAPAIGRAVIAPAVRIGWKDLFFSFRGRINRKTFLLRGLLPLIVVATGLTLALAALVVKNGQPLQSPIVANRFRAMFLVVEIMLLWPSFALTVKRLHDRNRTGWFVLLNIAGIVNSVLFGLLKKTAAAGFMLDWIFVLISVALFIAGLWLFIETFFLKGSAGENRYGATTV